MSANNPTAVFSIVRDALRATDSDVSYPYPWSLFSTVNNFYESVDLVDPHGHGCVNPDSIRIDPLDVMYDLSGGGRARFERRLPYRIRLQCVSLAGEAQAKLRRMMLNNNLVYFSPDFCDRTAVAWYPGIQTTDLVGNYLSVSIDSQRNNVWDDLMETRAMRNYATQHRVVGTPYGTGFIGERANENVGLPTGSAYPLSGVASAAGAGWLKSANLTFTHVPGGFGHSDCPDSIRVTGAATTADRYMIMDIAPEIGANDRVCFGVFMRGHIPSTASIYIRDYEGAVNNIVERIYFAAAGYDFSDWTIVRISAQKTWVFDGTTLPDVVLALASPAIAEACDFEVGANILTCKTDSYPQMWPNWITPGAAKTADVVTISGNGGRYPPTWSLAYSFYVPEWFDPDHENMQDRYFICGLTEVNSATNAGKMNISRGGSAGYLHIYFAYYYHAGDAETRSLSGEFAYTPGKAHVIHVVCGYNSNALYVDGVLIDQNTDDASQGSNIPNASIDISRESYGAWPLIPLAMRIDEKVMTHDEVADQAVNMTNTGALEVRVPARGRKFRIKAIPISATMSYNEFAYDGMLELEQFEYDELRADNTCVEGV